MAPLQKQLTDPGCEKNPPMPPGTDKHAPTQSSRVATLVVRRLGRPRLYCMPGHTVVEYKVEYRVPEMHCSDVRRRVQAFIKLVPPTSAELPYRRKRRRRRDIHAHIRGDVGARGRTQASWSRRDMGADATGHVVPPVSLAVPL
jgi:hypothetical protein